MSAFFGISLWIILAVFIPGLITIAVVLGAVLLVRPELFHALDYTGNASEWVFGAVAITVMILTQYLGILLEGFLIRRQWLGPETIDVPRWLRNNADGADTIDPYREYRAWDILLADLEKDEDSRGHLERALALFFLSNNTLISFGIGIPVTAALLVSNLSSASLTGPLLYIAFLTACVWTSYKVTLNRFAVMARSLWTVRRRRIVTE